MKAVTRMRSLERALPLCRAMRTSKQEDSPIILSSRSLTNQSCNVDSGQGSSRDHRSVHTSTSRRQKRAVGVFGAGRVAANVHIPNILSNPRLDLRWVVENNIGTVKSLQENLYLDIPFYTSDNMAALLDDDSLDGVFVFTPTSTHYSIILSSLERGKAVFTEKPTAESLEDIATLYDTAERVGRPLLTGYNRRFDPAYRDIYEMIVGGQIGKLHVAKVTTRDSPKPSYELLKGLDRTGCNILSDLAVHDFDYLTWIMQGAAPVSVYVITHAHDPIMAEIGQADAVGVVLKYPCGAIAMIDTTRESCYGYDQRVELFGSRGMASSENPRQSFATKNFDMGALQKPMMYSFPQRFKDSFQKEIDHFVDCLEGTASPAVTKEDCMLTALVMDAALESYRLNQAVDFCQFLAERGRGITQRQVT